MKNILLDTNIYGIALWKKDVAHILVFLADEKQKPEKKFIILGSEIINNEINATPHKETRNRLCELYQVVISGEIKLSDNIKSLAKEYFIECKNKHVKITLEDCLIAASSSFANVDFIVTDNRKTMMNPKSIDVFTSINKRKKLRMPAFIGCEALKRLLFSSGVS